MPLFGRLAPKGITAPVVEKISTVLRTSIRQGEMQAKLKSMGFEPIGSTPQELSQRISGEIARWNEVIRKGEIQAE